MTAEERILAYIDGSLSEHESAELLHELSVSPEKRVVLEQHLKLAELNRLAQKPFEVPAELEEQMRRRLPVIIPSSNAAPVAMRRGAIASLLLLLRSYPTRVAIGTLLVLLSGAAAYLLSDRDHGSTSTQISQNVQNAAPSPRGTTAPVESKNATTPTTTSTATSEPAAASTTRNSARSATVTTTTPSSSAGASSTNTTVSSKLLTNHSSTASHRSLKNTKIATPLVVDRSNETSIGQTTVDHSNSNTTNQTIADASQASSIGVIKTASVHSQYVAAISPGEMREHYRLNPFEMIHNAQRSPWTVRFSIGLGETFLNVPTGNSSYTTRTESSPFIGVNYSVSPSFAVGAVVGNSTILTVSPQSDVTEINGVKNVTVHSYSTNSQQWFARLASRYSIALGGSWNLEASAEAGMLLASKSPMVCLQALGSQNLSDAIDFQFGVLASGVWTTPASVQTSSTDQSTASSGVITYRTNSQPAVSKIFSPAITGRVGLQYRF